MLFADCEGNGYLEELTKLWTIQIAEDDGEIIVYADQPGYPRLKEAIERLKKADKVVIHFGLGFDLWAINKVYPDTLRWDQIIDTVILSRIRNPVSKDHSLKGLGESLNICKGEFDDFSRFSEEMVVYGKQDVHVLRSIWKKRPRPNVPSLKEVYDGYARAVACEHRVGWIIARQEQHGFKFNEGKGERLNSELVQEQLDLGNTLKGIFTPRVTERYSEKTGKKLKEKVEVFNPGSRQQIADRLTEKYGWDPSAHTPSGQVKVDETILADLPWHEAKACSRYMRLGKMLGQLSEGDNAWLKLVKNGRIHGRVNPIGCRTHRMSHYKPNVAQADSDPRMRALFEPDEGCVLVGCDAEGLELRMLAHYLAKYDGGAYGRTVVEGRKEDGTDVHTVNQRIADLYFRDSAKTLIYALIYGAADPKLGMIFRLDRRKKGEEIKASNTTLGRALRLRMMTGIPGLGKLVEAVKKAHKKKGRILSLDGRPIPSNSEHSALNTLLQGAGAVVMKWALVLFDEWLLSEPRNWLCEYCANVHDEVQLSVTPEYAEEVGQKFAECITKAGELLGVRCPLSGSFAIGANWSETH